MRPDPSDAAQALRALQVLIQLSSESIRAQPEYNCVPLEWFRWMTPKETTKFHSRTWDIAKLPIKFPLDRHYTQRIHYLQQVRGPESLLRVGFHWISGIAGGANQLSERVFFPLYYAALHPSGSDFSLHCPVGLNPLAKMLGADDYLPATLNYSSHRIATQGWLRKPLLAAIRELGFKNIELSREPRMPEPSDVPNQFFLIPFGATYVATDEAVDETGAALVDFVGRLNGDHTAFHSVYGSAPISPPTTTTAERAGLVTAMPLTDRQRDIVLESREAGIEVISGAPGTGKSHAVTAIVADAVNRGESVLVAARSDASVDALDALFRTQANIEPVVFGSSQSERQVLRNLLATSERVNRGWVDILAQRLSDATDRRCKLRTLLSDRFASDALRSGADGARVSTGLLAARLRPGDADEVDNLLADLTTGSRWRRGRSRRALRRLRALLAAEDSIEDAMVVDAARFAQRQRQATDSNTAEMTISGLVADLLAADRRAEDDFVAYLRAELQSERRLSTTEKEALDTLNKALNDGYEARRAALAQITNRSLTHALPVWLGKLGDIGAVLPPTPGLFDLTLIDEAASTVQAAGAHALLRARRAVIVGDPRQLRPVSFLSDTEIDQALDTYGVSGLDRTILNVRRNSLFDAATNAAVPVVLDEHFRCAPHLFDFVARELYDDTVKVATRNPVSQSIDCVRIHDTRIGAKTPPTRNADGVVEAEVAAVVELLRRRSQYRARSIGVITPFRAQADAIEDAVYQEFSNQQVIDMDLRIGTVHGFQGNERNDVFVSLGLVDDDPAGWRFATQPNLLTVMLTRARLLMTVIASCTPDPDSILGRYLAQCDRPPGPPPPARPLTAWGEAVAVVFEEAGIDPMRSYRCGRHIVDLAFERQGKSIGILCEMHTDGVDAHIERHLELVSLGWQIHELLPALCDDDPTSKVIEIVTESGC